MCQSKVFISKLGSAVNSTRSSSIAIDEISALNHEIFDLHMLVRCRWPGSVGTYHSMELTSLVALRLSLGVLALTGAELTEILCCSRGDIGEQFHFHPAQGLAYRK